MRFELLGVGATKVCETGEQGECRVELEADGKTDWSRWVAIGAAHQNDLEAKDIVPLPGSSEPVRVELVSRGVAPQPADPRQLSWPQLLVGVQRRLHSPSELPPGPERDHYARAAALLLDEGRADEAEAELEGLVRRHPVCVSCRTLMALSQLTRGGWSSAVEQLEEAARITARPDAPAHRSEPWAILAVLA